MNLTKSLHTVTAVVRVALYINDINPVAREPGDCVDRALRVLGHDPKGMHNDSTYIACVKAYNKTWET